jgi:hypothetical protein
MAQVKGVSIVGMIKFMKKYSEDLLPKVKNALPPESAKYLDEHILATKWYPYQLFVDMLLALDRILGKGDLEFCVEQGRLSARHDVASIYKIFLMFINTKMLVAKAMTMWNSYFDTGKVEVSSYADSGSDKHLAVVISGFPGMDMAHIKNVMGWIEEFLVMSKFARSVEPKIVKCQKYGDPVTELYFKAY